MCFLAWLTWSSPKQAEVFSTLCIKLQRLIIQYQNLIWGDMGIAWVLWYIGWYFLCPWLVAEKNKPPHSPLFPPQASSHVYHVILNICNNKGSFVVITAFICNLHLTSTTSFPLHLPPSMRFFSSCTDKLASPGVIPDPLAPRSVTVTLKKKKKHRRYKKNSVWLVMESCKKKWPSCGHHVMLVWIHFKTVIFTLE